ncbi:hypothetical protein LRP52_43130 [Photobacterium sp. ZSDE20]|uniref:Uncharacterized protein n=1 Tax=Photobacterium pectinilyticum TaxID=2906793 RepID=A0ABT1N4F0_9GAMM|nr:hypothetical protein [Photobacterium sp. ZSDE20]MCQ1059599.1 hypothetical protein [Photobacterium sp. ZSDE20]MDD1828966.1 hypothetical protein [Photobacterium sp. ZSDE20]
MEAFFTLFVIFQIAALIYMIFLCRNLVKGTYRSKGGLLGFLGYIGCFGLILSNIITVSIWFAVIEGYGTVGVGWLFISAPFIFYPILLVSWLFIFIGFTKNSATVLPPRSGA